MNEIHVCVNRDDYIVFCGVCRNGRGAANGRASAGSDGGHEQPPERLQAAEHGGQRHHKGEQRAAERAAGERAAQARDREQ